MADNKVPAAATTTVSTNQEVSSLESRTDNQQRVTTVVIEDSNGTENNHQEASGSGTQENQVAAVQTVSTILPQNSATSISSGPLSISFNFNSVEDSTRMLANNLTSTIGEISPLINFSRSRPAISFQEWLNPNRQRHAQLQPAPAVEAANPDSVVINMDGHETASESSQTSSSSDNSERNNDRSNFDENFNNAEGGNSGGQSNNNNNSDANSVQSAASSPEARAAHRTIDSYFPFLMILFMKAFYDNAAEILNFLIIVATFIQANNDLKREIIKQQNRSRMVLLGIICYIIGCFVFINFVYVFVFNEQAFPLSSPPTSIWQLIWTVAVTDYILKLITVCVKVLLTMLPSCVLPLQKRGKYYLVIEAASQLYRSGAPLKPWLLYLCSIYEGPDKMLGMVLFVMYSIHKGGDIMNHVKQFFTACWKMLQDVSLGTAPTKEQIVASGGTCAICHEEYSSPVRLHCKHIFCEGCVATWLDRERSCPLCRASITDDPIYRDGHTTHYVQLY